MLSFRLVLPSIAAVVLLTVGTRLNAAVTYHFSSSTEGTYPGHSEGTVVMEGKRWRIDYERDPNEVTVFDAIIGTEAADMIAINDSNQTWYRFKSPAPLEIQSPLFTFFTFGSPPKVSRIVVARQPSGTAKGGGAPDRADARVTFSYRLVTRVGPEDVRTDVWGQVRAWTVNVAEPRELPWKPLEIRTGLDAVDEALRIALVGAAGIARKSETEVSRQLEGGAVLHQVIRREIGSAMTTAAVPTDRFTVPTGYRYQEPVIGAPGASPVPVN